jgi:hypothetical protein
MVGSLREEKMGSFMGYEGSFISMTLLRYSYQVLNLGNCAMKLCIETNLRVIPTYSLHEYCLYCHIIKTPPLETTRYNP